MSKEAKEASRERARRKVELDLDRELEATFPASDPLKITRSPPKSLSRRNGEDDGSENT
jgi:hypothetical protein